MHDATQLTREGKLQAATDAIQRALRGQPADGADPHAPIPSPSFADGLVIDVPARVISDAPAAERQRRAGDASAVPPPAEDGQAAQWTSHSFSRQGRTLPYRLYVPPQPAGTARPQRPLLLMLHGCTQDPDDFAAGTRMNQLAHAEGAVVIYPAQTRHANAQGCWNWFKPQHQQRGRGEPALLAALTQSVMASQDIDPARVYVAGLSAGGAMADILGHAYPDLFAAVGVHSGLAAGSATDLMSALAAMRSGAPGAAADGARRPPVIVFHGSADATVHPRNGQAVAGAAHGPAIDGTSAGGQSFTRTTHPGSDTQRATEHWLLHGAGHAWAGGSAQGSYTDPRGPDASAEMLRFFLAHPMRKA
ncbi:MAG: PHB depolymerase family esterase [Variovorax sp.]|nr:MAG: PHB depolymerase family esterase [Variovorax sp.]